MQQPLIRPIQIEDNKEIARVIRTVLVEHNVPKVGTAYEDTSLDCMFETYNADRSAYFVLEEEGKIIGGGGIAPLAHFDGNVCELQKMYFLAQARGRGLGTKMIDQCLEHARTLSFEKCYLETMPYMEAARKLYKKYGFSQLEGPLGDTGHFSCEVHMIKEL